MGTYVTDTGFNTQTFEINKLYWETQLQTIFGSDIDLDPETAARINKFQKQTD